MSFKAISENKILTKISKIYSTANVITLLSVNYIILLMVITLTSGSTFCDHRKELFI